MTLQANGTIKLSQVQAEHGGSNPIKMSEYYRGVGIDSQRYIELTGWTTGVSYGPSDADATVEIPANSFTFGSMLLM